MQPVAQAADGRKQAPARWLAACATNVQVRTQFRGPPERSCHEFV